MRLKTKLKVMRKFLIGYTIFVISHFSFYWFYASELKGDLHDAYVYAGLLIKFSFIIYVLRFIWQFYPVSTKKKRELSFMIVFLDFIGMWLWFPDKREREKLNIN